MFRKGGTLYIFPSSNIALLRIEMSFRSKIMFKNAEEQQNAAERFCRPPL